MITCEHLAYAYPAGELALDDITLTIPDGAFVLVAGVSCAGKSTLLRAFNGLVPQFYGGRFGGSVLVNGQDTLKTPPRQVAGTVGFVFQDPETQFVVQRVEDEIAFGLENAGAPPAEIRERLERVLDMLAITHLRTRHVATLSGGEGQRVAIASALALNPDHLVLDEPTSQLDPPAAHDLLDRLVALNRRGLTVILAEHRLERVLSHATHLLHLEPGAYRFGPVRDVLPHLSLRPPVVEAALQLGWRPLPLDIAEAQPFIRELRLPPPRVPLKRTETEDAGSMAIETRGLHAGHDGRPVLHDISWRVKSGEIVGLLGLNGSGKTTLLKTLIGLLPALDGEVLIQGRPVRGAKARALAAAARHVGYVPQNPNSVLFAETLAAEVAFTRRNHGLPADGTVGERILADLELSELAGRYPRDLSGGERQRAALAAMLAAEPPVVLLDEPTRGLDYLQKQRLARLLERWRLAGKAIVIATHDVEWIATVASRITALAGGEIVADGRPGDVLLRLPGFTPQLGMLLQHPDFLTPAALAAWYTPER